MTRKKAKRSGRKKGPNNKKNLPSNAAAADATGNVITTKNVPIIERCSGPSPTSSQASSYISLSRVNWINNMATSLAKGETKNRDIIMNEVCTKDINFQDLQCRGSFIDRLATYRMKEVCTKDFKYVCRCKMNLLHYELPVPKSNAPSSPSNEDKEKKPSTFTTHAQYKESLLEVCRQLPNELLLPDELLNLIVLDMIGYCALDESIYPKKECSD